MEEGWLDQLVAATHERGEEERPRLEAFLAEPRPSHALAIWLAPAPGEPRLSSQAIATRLLRDIAALDDLIERQVNAILHHPTFQRLEASWRGLRWLVGTVPDEAQVKIRLLSVSWQELARDAERAIEFDQSQLFKKVYSAEFGTAGGEPFGLLIGD